MTRALAAAVLLLIGTSCAAPWYQDVRFAPSPQEIELRGDTNDLEARIAVAWLGFGEREDAIDLHFRVSVENPGFTPFTLVPARFELVDGALVPIGVVSTEAAAVPVAVQPGRSTTFDLAFSVADEEELARFDLSVVMLRMRLQGERWSWSTNFQRVELAPYPYYGPAWHVGIGVAF